MADEEDQPVFSTRLDSSSSSKKHKSKKKEKHSKSSSSLPETLPKEDEELFVSMPSEKKKKHKNKPSEEEEDEEVSSLAEKPKKHKNKQSIKEEEEEQSIFSEKPKKHKNKQSIKEEEEEQSVFSEKPKKHKNKTSIKEEEEEFISIPFEKPKKHKNKPSEEEEEEESMPSEKPKKRKNKPDPTLETHPTEIETNTKKSSKHKKLKLKLQAISDMPNKTAPVVGYFPSGFKPNSHEDGSTFELYRHARHPNRLEAVVRPANSNVEFVGTSYAGEAAAPQMCTYALGVFDKEDKTLKIVPIAANKILRFEPRVKRDEEPEPAQSEGLTELSSTGKSEKRIQDLTSIYGTKHDKSRDKRFKTLFDQKNYDLGEGAEFLNSQDQETEQEAETVDKSKGPDTFRNIPPYNPNANVAEKIYDLGKIIPSGERPYLLEILDNYHNENKVVNYPSFVKNRLDKLDKAKGSEREKLAIILSYITHLHSTWDQYRKPPTKPSQNPTTTPHIPRTTRHRLTSLFVDSESKQLSSDKLELLIGYILVLTLFVDGFETDLSDIAKDLMMTNQGLKPYFMQLGCVYEKAATVGKKGKWKLSVPLEFADMRKRMVKKNHIK